LVPAGAAYEALRSEIAEALRRWRDPRTGELVVEEVVHGETVYGKDAAASGPDLIPALRPGYGLGRGEGLGRVMVGRSLIEANESPWSGGHEGPYRASDVPGVAIMWGPRVPEGRALTGASLHDIAPTVLSLLGLEVPSAMEGRALL
jgi:predicted AlkP superfamily phosphohydrolase/phosphomutase